MVKLGCWLLVMVWLTGCNTISGMGRDIQKGGEKVQEAATSVQKKICASGSKCGGLFRRRDLKPILTGTFRLIHGLIGMA